VKGICGGFIRHGGALFRLMKNILHMDNASTISGISDASYLALCSPARQRWWLKYNGWKEEEGYLLFYNVFSVLKQERRPQTN
jgi:hypothetical protein